MDQDYTLSRLATIVALARARPGSTRLLLRNTDRFGVLHLYFSGGRLVSVEGHRDSPVASLTDLATWHHGVVRTDDAQVPLLGEPDARLEVALAHALQELAAHGVLQSPSLPRPHPAQTPPRPSPVSNLPLPAAHGPQSGALRGRSAPSGVAPGGLPPLAAAPEVPVGPPVAAVAESAPLAPGAIGNLTASHWQLIALMVRQIVSQAGAVVGEPLAVRMCSQALAHAARTHAALGPLSLELSGWLTSTPADAMLNFRCDDVVEGIADVLAGFETRCASVVGPERAKQILVAAVAPFRQGLVQIGFDIAS